MQEQKGLVLKREGRTCLILTPDWEFKNIPVSEKVQAGEEVSLPRKVTALTRVLLLAASICALFFGWLAYQAALPPAAAYVSLDFSPSLELGLDKEKKIVSVVPLDRTAEELLQDTNLKRKSFAEGVNTILEKALAEGYLRPAPGQTILVAVAPGKADAAPGITVQEVARIVREALGTKTQVRIIVTPATPEDRREAKAARLSLGRSLLRKAVEKEGKTIPVRVLREERLGEIEARNNISLEEIFRSQDKAEKSVIILPPKDREKKTLGQEIHLPQRQKEAEKLPPRRQKQAIPNVKAKKDGEAAKVSLPELAKPETTRSEILEAPLPEKPESRKPALEKPAKPVQPSLPVIVPEKKAPVQEERQSPESPSVPKEKTAPEIGQRYFGNEVFCLKNRLAYF